MNPATGPHGTPRKRPVVTAETTTEETTEDRLRRELNRHFRAALQRTLQIHRDRRREYADVLHRLDEYQSHLDRRRRDLGYESPHHDG